MSWSRVVWIEPDGDDEFVEYEQTIPTNWIVGKKVYWPNSMNVKRAYKTMESPGPNWNIFKLVKIKLTGGKFTFISIQISSIVYMRKCR